MIISLDELYWDQQAVSSLTACLGFSKANSCEQLCLQDGKIRYFCFEISHYVVVVNSVCLLGLHQLCEAHCWQTLAGRARKQLIR